LELSSDEAPFSELPQALVQEMFDTTNDLAASVAEHISKILTNKTDIRSKLKDRIRRYSEIVTVPKFPTTAGTDGSYHVDRLLSTDFVAVAAVAVEGLIPPKLTEPKWPRPRHFVKIESLAHDHASEILAKAIMLSMEMQLAVRAPHDVVFLDGSMTTITLAYNQAFAYTSPKALYDFLLAGDEKEPSVDRIKLGPLIETLKCYKEILEGARTDKIVATIPKYSRRNEICEDIGLEGYDDKGLLSLVLEAGEFTMPLKIQKEGGGSWLTAKLPVDDKSIVNDIEKLLNDFYVVYYKPYENFPAMRLEMAKSVALNDSRLAILLEAVYLQSGAPGMMEPYPTYMADRMVKHLSTAMPAIIGFSIKEIAAKWKGEVADIYLAMHGYRT